MSRFGAIRSGQEGKALIPETAPTSQVPSGRAASRVGKKALCGYFSADLSRSLRQLGLEQDKSLQALMGEAFDDLLRKYGKHPFGER